MVVYLVSLDSQENNLLGNIIYVNISKPDSEMRDQGI